MLPLIRDMSDTQLEKLEAHIRSELWDRNNQPNGQIFNESET